MLYPAAGSPRSERAAARSTLRGPRRRYQNWRLSPTPRKRSPALRRGNLVAGKEHSERRKIGPGFSDGGRLDESNCRMKQLSLAGHGVKLRIDQLRRDDG
jgi:hypothetical protein